MKKSSLAFLLSLHFFFSACGKKGPIFPPLSKIPMKVRDAQAVQRGAKVVVTWKNPGTYVDGIPLKENLEVEIWLLEREVDPAGLEEPVPVDDFDRVAELVAALKKEQLAEYYFRKDRQEMLPLYRFFYSLDRGQLGHKLFFGLRVRDEKGRMSPFVVPDGVEPRIVPGPPRNPKASVMKDKILLEWSPPEANIDRSLPLALVGYNIYRVEEPPAEKEGEKKEGEFRLLNKELIRGTSFDDQNFVFGNAYRYLVRASATEPSPHLESADSEEVAVEAKDAFAPAPPGGLVAVASEKVIGLSWEAGKEKDLKGYLLYRRAEGEREFRLLTPQPIRENAFNDTEVEKNKRYYYAISALDETGNESPKSDPVSEVIKGGRG